MLLERIELSLGELGVRCIHQIAKRALEVFSSMLGVVPLPGVMLEALDDASGLSWSDVASWASSLPFSIT